MAMHDGWWQYKGVGHAAAESGMTGRCIMCELLGLCFNTEVNPHISFRGFRHRGKNNPHGWGLAFYPDESCQIFKEALPAGKSSLAYFLESYDGVRSKIIIGHVRLASRGDVSRRNTHPFVRELNGKEYVFAHNGTLHDCGSLETGRFKPVGETDSERAFCHLLNLLEKERIKRWGENECAWLKEELRRINEKGRLNCLLSDGEHLFCYHDRDGYNGLRYLRRQPPYARVRLKDADWEIDLSEEKRDDQKGFVVATRPLTDEAWEPFKPGELMVFADGSLRYPSKRRSIA